ncbi:MAG: hypothetical protein R3231_06795 [bacterium]|nr:hypothetical protein [bacterium]
MKVAVAVDKKGNVSKALPSCGGFLIFHDSGRLPADDVVRLNPYGDHHFGLHAPAFPRLSGRLAQMTGQGQAYTISRILHDCAAIICRGSGRLLLLRLQEKGLPVIVTEIADPGKALGIYWNSIKKTAA